MVLSRDRHHALHSAQPEQVYKSDHRSRVWRVTVDRRPYVVKQFVYSPLRQFFARLLGVHPAQREWRRHRALIVAGLPVVPIVARGVKDCKYWLATEQVGESLQAVIRADKLKDAALREQTLEQIAKLTQTLFQAGYTHRDHKTSNLLIDDQHKLWMIDVGAVRHTTHPKQIARTLAMLDHTLEKDGFTKVERSQLRKLITSTITHS